MIEFVYRGWKVQKVGPWWYAVRDDLEEAERAATLSGLKKKVDDLPNLPPEVEVAT